MGGGGERGQYAHALLTASRASESDRWEATVRGGERSKDGEGGGGEVVIEEETLCLGAAREWSQSLPVVGWVASLFANAEHNNPLHGRLHTATRKRSRGFSKTVHTQFLRIADHDPAGLKNDIISLMIICIW